MSDQDYDIEKNYVAAVEGFEDALADIMFPQQVVVVIVDYIDGRTVYHTFDTEDKAASFVETKSGANDVEVVSYAFTFMNHTDADEALFTVH